MSINLNVTSATLDLVYEAVEGYKWSLQQDIRQLTSTPKTEDPERLAWLNAKVEALREIEFQIADIQEGFDESWSSNKVLADAANQVIK